MGSGDLTVLEVIKLEFIIKLKIKRNHWLRVRKQPILVLYFEFETVLEFYNLEARSKYVSLLDRSQ